MEKANRHVIVEANNSLFVDGNVEDVDEFFAIDYAVHVTGRTINGGHKIVRAVVGELRKSFPDLTVNVEILVEGQDRVAWQRTFRGTHKSKFKGFPPSDRAVEWRDMVTSRFVDGRITEEWVITDLAEQLLLSRKKGV
ncbi:ester cyclase [Marinimicrobium sp. ABcell2]|uniref:ester cyclase n=1 Tax=Marinimicrobium sp. ABcell2 TaxID=3069751 RepID=UPI0027AE1104|nr:ester cyclase [Marinimicrobium sp. ABcell2]MDQ2076392.1 ester cyclase [Marinimicrobium sp. ABcell2]